MGEDRFSLRRGRSSRSKSSRSRGSSSGYDNETLAPLGMKKVHKDEFFYEVKREEVKS
jgi:hypothetical protein